MAYLLGPATVIVAGSSFGNTFGGINLSVVTKTLESPSISGDDYVFVDVPICVKGVLKRAEFEQHLVEDDLERNDFCEVVATGDNYRLTIYNCKLFYPKALSVGTMPQKSFDVNFLGKKDSSGRIYYLEEI